MNAGLDPDKGVGCLTAHGFSVMQKWLASLCVSWGAPRNIAGKPE